MFIIVITISLIHARIYLFRKKIAQYYISLLNIIIRTSLHH